MKAYLLTLLTAIVPVLELRVAIPLPGTGAWTGSLVAALMDIPMKKSLPAIFLGVIIAAIIVSCITYGVTAIF